MVTIVFRQADGRDVTVTGREGDSIMQAAVVHGVPGVIGECGGSLACATCHCYVEADWVGRLPAISQTEDDMLDCTMAERRPESRLTCQITIDPTLEGIVLHVPGDNL